jgi:hypothetical protein
MRAYPQHGIDWFALVLGVAGIVRWQLGLIPVVLTGGEIGLLVTLSR